MMRPKVSACKLLASYCLASLLLLQQPSQRQAQASYLSGPQLQQQQQQTHNNQQQSASSEQPPQAPSIIPFSFNQNVQENQRASVMCTTSSGETPVSFAWLKDGQILTAQLAQSRRILIKPDQDSSTLKISSVRLDHAGNYTCLAKNRFGSQLHSAQLVVHGEPRWLKEPQLEPIVATRGQSVVIDCQTTGWPRPQQTWQIKTHNQGEFEPLATIGYGRLSLAPNGSLVIRNADKLDEANYLCKSSNGIGKGLSWSTSLKVTVPAHFEAPRQQTSTIRKGSQVQLRCDAYGDQPISIEWFKNKQPLVASHITGGPSEPLNMLSDVRYSIHSNNNPLKNGLISQLSIRQAQRQDNSVYECVTKNPHGRDRLPIELVVQEEPDNIQELQLTQVSSRSATLMWNEPYDGRSPITSYMFQYKRVQQQEVVISSQLVVGLNGELDSYMDTILPLSGSPLATTGAANSGKAPVVEQGDWQQASRIVLPMNSSQTGSVKSITIERLEPSSKYILRALAINSIGQSKFSQPMEFSTDEEAPEVGPVNIRAQAINSTSIQVSWDEIHRSKHLGRIHGYYIGYRVANNNSAAATFIYKPYIINDLVAGSGLGSAAGGQAATGQASDPSQQQQVISNQQQQQSRLETVIQDLRRDTVYEITVVAFNSRGSGPSSDFVVCKTIEMEAPKPVKLAIRRESNESIFIEWQRDPTDQNPVDDYVLYQEKNSASQEWLQVRLPGNQTHYKAPGLKCGTRYQFYIIAHNKVGKSQPSEVVSASTSGALPMIPSKTSLLKWINSTCLLVNLNSFQDNGCRIKTFTVRYRVEKQQQQQLAADGSGSGQVGASSAGQAAASTASGTGQLIGSNGMSASHQALTAASQVGGKTVQAGQSNNAASSYASEWIAIRPKSNLKQQRANEEDRMEYLCDLSPVGEYTIHVAAGNDVGRSEIEYTVLMSSDELRHSLWKEWLELVSGLPNVFAYVPSILVFVLAALSLVIVCLILYTTAIKYYQKFVIMQNQMRATRRAKADEKRRRKLQSQNMSSSRHSQKLAELWADEYEEDDQDQDDRDTEGGMLDQDLDYQGDGGDCERIIGSSEESVAGLGAIDGDDEDEATATEELQSSSSSSGGRRVRGRKQQQSLKHCGKQSQDRRGLVAAVRRNNTIQPVRHHQHHHQYQHTLNPHLQHRQLHQYSGSNPHNSNNHYLANLTSSAFDTSSIDSPCNNAGKPFGGSGSACMSTASTDSIHGRFQCLNSKQYVKMNEYTMLPTISARLSSPANDTIYGTAPAPPMTRQQHSSPAVQYHRQMNGTSPSANSSASNTASSQATNSVAGSVPPNSSAAQNASSLYYSTLRRTNMQTYLPQQQQQPPRQQINRRQSQNMADICGYYMAPPGQAQAAAAQQAANEAANSIFVPPQQIIYSAPNIRRQPPVFL